MFESLISETFKKSIESKSSDPLDFKESSFKVKNELLSASDKELSNYNRLIDSHDYSIPDEIGITKGVDTLREKIVQAHPELNEQNVSKIKGDISEDMMGSYFKNSGWSKKEGEVGSNGIDGLYIKRDSAGKINNVLAVESKYNTSKLGETNAGMQMSKEWLVSKVDALIKAHSEDQDYADIKKLISEDKYRARLWKMNEVDNKLYMGLENIDSLGRDISITPLAGGEKYKINNIANQKVDLNIPSSIYHTKLVSNYSDILEKRIYSN